MSILAYIGFLWSSVQTEVGLASRYGYPGDPYEPTNQPYACEARLKKAWGFARWKRATTEGVAHRTLPCGTKLLICRKDINRCASATVVDRGPYGALDSKGRWHARKRLKPGERWRGVVDLLPGIAYRLKVRGLHMVSVWCLQTQATDLITK